MARRPTISHLAAAAGVSVATVDRVLNRRHKVRSETAERVLAAAQSIGFHATALLKHIATPGLSLEQVFKRVRVNVIASTQAKQTPWEMSSLSKDIVFVTR